MIRSALAYARKWPWGYVFPLSPRSKVPAIRGGQGHRDATRDLEQIRAWWAAMPNANVGLSCRELVVLDVDPRHDGDEHLAELEAEHGELPHTVTQLSGGQDGGWHLLFQRPAGYTGAFRKELCPGVEIKADGYIVVAPSVHPSGGKYRWDVGAHPVDTPIAAMPPWLTVRAISFERPVKPPICDVGDGLLAIAFARAGWVLRRLSDRKLAVWCPWEHEHSAKNRGTSTVIFAPTEDQPHGTFHCSHAHCAGKRSYRDVLGALPREAVLATRAADDEDIERAAIMAEGAG